LQDKVGIPAEVWQDIGRRVFGAEGLAGGRFRTTLDTSGCLRALFSMTSLERYNVRRIRWENVRKSGCSYVLNKL